MKNDSMEKFVARHRDQFDDKQPSDKVWSRISSALFDHKTVSLWNSVILWRSAAVILLGVSIYLFVAQPDVIVRSKEQVAQHDFSDIESFYSEQITEKVALISKEGAFVDDTFTQDLQKLEATYTVLAEEMKKHPSDKVKDALVLTMLVRIDLLNQQIHKLEQSKENKSDASAMI